MFPRSPSPNSIPKPSSLADYPHYRRYRTNRQPPPPWILLSLLANGVLVAIGLAWWLGDIRLELNDWAAASSGQAAPATATTLLSSPQPLVPTRPLNIGERHQLKYDEWVSLLASEARVAADRQPKNLIVLAGDSISLWFPHELLPPGFNWLNQGISGETSAGLLGRLDLFDKTKPTAIFVLIGINDLIRGIKSDTLVENQRQIVRYLRRVHPRSRIVLQSILPHGDLNATWEGRDRLLAIPNDRIRAINQRLAAIAQQEGATYLNLHTLFTDPSGNLNPAFSTDGLHLNPQGYLVWSSALQVFSQLELQSGS